MENEHGDQYPGLAIIQTSTGASNVTIAGNGSAKFGNIEFDGVNSVAGTTADAPFVIESSGTHGVALNWTDGSGTGGLAVYSGDAAHNLYLSAKADGLRVYDGAGNLSFLVDPDGDIHMIATGAAKLCFDATHYLYLSGNDIYWWNGGAGTKLN